MNSGAFWQQYCNEKCLAAGFKHISDNWPCAYWNETTQHFLAVYVDDMELAGPLSLVTETWNLLGRGITLEEPKGNKDKVMTFLGCEHRRVEKEITTPNGKV